MQIHIGKGKKAQNEKEHTPHQQLNGNAVIQKAEKQEKTIQKNTLYSDQAIAVAKAAMRRSL